MKKKFQLFLLTNFLTGKGYFKVFPEKRFSGKKQFFVFCQKFCFNLEKLSNHYSQLKKQVKVDPETRSYDFLMKTREKNPMYRNITDLGTISEYAMNTPLHLKKIQGGNMLDSLRLMSRQGFRLSRTFTFQRFKSFNRSFFYSSSNLTYILNLTSFTCPRKLPHLKDFLLGSVQEMAVKERGGMVLKQTTTIGV